MPHTDTSGATALTLFDFNNDGVVELVYRDETHIQIFDGSGNAPDLKHSQPCGSATIVETPIIVDVTGDGSANILVTGDPGGTRVSLTGELMVFEGGASKWMSCPNVWNQQLYSNLLVNTDLTIPKTVLPVNLTFTRQDNTTVQFYNGGPLQAPLVSEETYLPVDLSPDVFVVSGSIVTLSPTSVQITAVFGNQGMATASASMPIQYYKNLIAPGNIVGNATLGVDLEPGQTCTIVKTITGLNPMPGQFYVRILDNGTNFPATGAYSDCNLTNNTKSFGTLELQKSANALNACIDGTSIFYVNLINNTNLSGTPTTFTNIVLTDSLGTGWQYVSQIVINGSLSAYNTSTRKMQWTLPSIAPGDTAKLIIVAKSIAAGAIRNSAWVESVNGTVVGKEAIEAYVIVNSSNAPAPAIISPSNPSLCTTSSVALSSSITGAGSYQWYRNMVEIPGATLSTFTAYDPGSYNVTYFDGTCVSQMSPAVTIPGTEACVIAYPDYASTTKNTQVTVTVLDNDLLGLCTTSNIVVTLTQPTRGSAALTADKKIVYTPQTGFVGQDSLTYTINCSGNTSTTKVYVTVTGLPDNIVNDADCFTTPPVQAWGIRQATISPYNPSTQYMYAHSEMLVGDMNGDGVAEIIAGSTQTGISPYNAVNIYNSDGVFIKKINTAAVGGLTGKYAIARVKIDATHDTTLLFVASTDQYIYAYTYTGTSYFWRSDTQFGPSGSSIAGMAFADFNHDGYAELYVNNHIYDAATGKLLVVGTGNKGAGNIYSSTYAGNVTVATNITGGSNLDLVAGNAVYRVNITNRTGTADNTMTAAITLPAFTMEDGTTAGPVDGITQIADFDDDGHPDVIVSNISSSIIYFYVWSPYKNQLLARKTLTDINTKGISMLGDIDGDGRPEIVFNTVNVPDNALSTPKTWAFKYVNNNTVLQQFWQLDTHDLSGFTGMTLFDFNQDGISELVYRDNDSLRIINGSHKHHETLLPINYVYNLASFACQANTAGEYPIVANLGGQTKIVTSKKSSMLGGEYADLVLYEAAETTWAPSRKVWNQYAYFSVHVNEDLTIPQYQINPAMAFAGIDGLLGNSNDVHPYNNFLQQQTALNRNGLPLWLLPNAKVIATPLYNYFSNGDSLLITLKVTNIGNAALKVPLYLSIYKNTVATGNVLKIDSITHAINVGDTATKVIKIPNFKTLLPFANLVVSINDKGQAAFVQQECEYSDNETTKLTRELGIALDDTQTVQEYQIVVVDILTNDQMSVTGFPPASLNLVDSVIPGSGPFAGTLTGTGSGSTSKIIYQNNGTVPLVNNIDSFKYRYTFFYPPTGTYKVAQATVYIYVLQDLNGASTCANTSYTTNMAIKPSLPVPVQFSWYSAMVGETFISTTPTRTVTGVTTDTTLVVQPVINDPTQPYNKAGGFPRGLFTIGVVNKASAVAYMRWTGIRDTLWNNPNNWVQVITDGGQTYESPTAFPPSTCVDVVIPQGAPNYPVILSDQQNACRNIKLEDRALLKNPKGLTYTAASVEIKLKPSERDRFIMWSAPLRSMYSGDYHYKNANTNLPQWGDVAVNLFQQANPVGVGSAVASTFTATFGKTDFPLELGQPFNLKVTTTSESKDKLLTFPQPNGSAYASDRSHSGRFITDTVPQTFSMNLAINGGMNLIQVVNPYLAYLDFEKFRSANTNLVNGYYIWNGDVNTGFTPVYSYGNRYQATGLSVTPDARLIPPLQSFIVAKGSGSTTNLPTVSMSSNFTTTSPGAYGDYALRSAIVLEGGILNIKASQGNKSSYAALVYDLNGSPARGDEDMPVVIVDEMPLTVYSLTSLNEPLAVNASSNFQSSEVPLGFRFTNAGETKLEFSGLNTFGHEVTLIDKQLNKEIPLLKTPEYTFTLAKTGTNAIELNNRFALKLRYTGQGIVTGNEAVELPILHVSTDKSHINVQSNDVLISDLYIYNAIGALVYSSHTPSDRFRIAVAGNQMYIINAIIDKENKSAKIVVR